jgi:DNA-binding response OmpR family regulator
MRLLIVEDENEIADPLKVALEKRGFAVDLADNGKTGLQKAQINEYDCLILDLNLPKLDGIEVAKQLRSDGSSVPILMLTARTSQNNINEGLEIGADDYLTKPFDFKELLLRIKAVIKRSTPEKNVVFSAHDINVDTASMKVMKSNSLIQLNAKEYGILEYLMRNKGRVISQEELLEHVWNEEMDAFTQTVRTNIKTLRKKVDPKKSIIKTFIGKGYVIE